MASQRVAYHVASPSVLAPHRPDLASPSQPGPSLAVETCAADTPAARSLLASSLAYRSRRRRPKIMQQVEIDRPDRER
jgi:hypothetical protein